MQCQNSDVEVFSQLDAGFFRRRREYVDIRFSWRVLCACTCVASSDAPNFQEVTIVDDPPSRYSTHPSVLADDAHPGLLLFSH